MATLMHPATLLVAWVALVAFSQMARGPIQWGFGLVVMAVSMMFARQRSLRLLRRVRVLVVVLVVLFVFFTPGEALLPFLGAAGPTVEGAAMAAIHVLRLVVVVMLVALLLEMADERALVSGLMVLALPLAGVGLSVERLAVRMLLVFRYVDAPPVGGWRALISAEADDAHSGALLVAFRPLRWRDRIIIGSLLALIVFGAFA